MLVVVRYQKGFSLVELLIVIAIMFLIAGLSLNFFRDTALESGLRNVGEALKMDLELARTKAIALNQRTRIFASADTGYYAFVDANNNQAYDAEEEIFLTRDLSSYSGNIVISSYSQPFLFKANGEGIQSRSMIFTQKSTGKSAKVSINLGQGTTITYF
ncbi:MAG: GspH/FimT family pseudopilin [Deltaproteobacteria bacterium]|nr:GspH/FimT family pseudopilin [Deltaproteobacteria bacterium]